MFCPQRPTRWGPIQNTYRIQMLLLRFCFKSHWEKGAWGSGQSQILTSCQHDAVYIYIYHDAVSHSCSSCQHDAVSHSCSACQRAPSIYTYATTPSHTPARHVNTTPSHTPARHVYARRCSSWHLTLSVWKGPQTPLPSSSPSSLLRTAGACITRVCFHSMDTSLSHFEFKANRKYE